MKTWEWVVIAVILAGAVIFTLVWWRLADTWADAEHKRFKSKGGGPVERVVIKGTGGGAPSPESAGQSAPEGGRGT